MGFGKKSSPAPAPAPAPVVTPVAQEKPTPIQRYSSAEARDRAQSNPGSNLLDSGPAMDEQKAKAGLMSTG